MSFASMRSLLANAPAKHRALAFPIAAAAVLLLLFSPAALTQPNQSFGAMGFAASNFGAGLRSLDIEIALQDDGSAAWRVETVYTEPPGSTTYLVLADIEGLSVKAGNAALECEASRNGIGTAISCPPARASIVVYTFRTPGIVRRIGDFKNFAYTFTISEPMELFALKISLPLGAALADPAKLEGTGLAPFRPSFGREGSNGRQILVSWNLPAPRVGDVIDASVIYEQLARGETPPLFWAVVALAIIVAGILGWLWHARNRPERLLPALGDRERPVMEIVIKHKSVDQRDIVKATNWPKAKVSRAIRVLADRGLVEALPKGRTKEVRLIEQKPGHAGILSKLLGFRIKQRAAEMGLSRAQAVELVQTTITPLIDWTERLSRALHSRKFGYAWSDSISDWTLEGGWASPLTHEQKARHLRDVKGLAPKVEERLSATEAALGEIERSLERLKDAILGSRRFSDLCKSLKGKSDNFGPKHLVGHIIDQDKIINAAYPWAPFWNSRWRELMKAADCAAVRKARRELEQSATKLRRAANLLKEELEGVREQLRQQYHILYREYRA